MFYIYIYKSNTLFERNKSKVEFESHLSNFWDTLFCHKYYCMLFLLSNFFHCCLKLFSRNTFSMKYLFNEICFSLMCFNYFQTVKLLCAMSMLLVVIPLLMGLTLDMIVTVPARVALNQTPLISLWQVCFSEFF